MKYFLEGSSGIDERGSYWRQGCFAALSMTRMALSITKRARATLVGSLVLVVFTGGWAAVEWKNVETGSTIESALYKWMPAGASKVLGLRPPKEAVPLLGALIQKQPTAELYSLKAMNEEASLDFAGAEADWKKYSETATERATGQLALADFYHRRLRPIDEIGVLAAIGKSPLLANEKLTVTTQQKSWQAFERVLTIVQANALPGDVAEQDYRNWMTRYPDAASVYARYFQLLLDHKKFADAEKLIVQYRAKFPKDDVFPVKARALLAYKQGSVAQGLAVYENNFQPLWDQELVQSYFDLMTETKSLRKFVDTARADLEKNPDDLGAAARVYYYYQRQGRTDAAQQTLTDYRLRKEQRAAKWNSQELYTLAKLEAGLNSHAEAARYYYALYNTNDTTDAQEQALAGLSGLLMSAPEQSVRLGSSELSMYKDIATLDPGPGFLNGIVSLVLNWSEPQYQYAQEEQRAVPYFHRAEAAELLRTIDAKYPNSIYRAGLHASLIEAYANYGESDAVIRDGKQFLASFPNAEDREKVSLLLADAYERNKRDQDEFALYDSLLAELGKKAEGLPIGAEQEQYPPQQAHRPPLQSNRDEEGDGEEASPAQPAENQRAFIIQGAKSAQTTGGIRSPEYSRVLERYLSRLVSTKRVPDALVVLRKEIDRNPNDPGLYERLASFLGQNQLGVQEEQVYQKAIQQFPDRNWYHKLARFYLREKRDADFNRLSEQVIKIFSGTELEGYFQNVGAPGNYYTSLNEYAHQRFPHDLYFTRNLIGAYWKNDEKREQLWRENWWQAEDLRGQYFEFLSRKGRLDSELAALKQSEPAAQQAKWPELASANPVVARFIGEVDLWRSHFEQAAPVVGALAQQFPGDEELGHRASAVFRSLAAFDPKNTDVAVAIEENLYKVNPGDRDGLARIGDILSDRELFDRAVPYWDRMATVRPGEPKAYLDAATVYWDYYNFNTALKLLNEGRTKLNDPALYSYEEGAIYESQRAYPAAVSEYVKGALKEHEGGQCYWRLLQLAPRPKLRDTVDQATASLADGTSPSLDSVKLRIAVLEAQNRPKEVERLLADIAGRTTSVEMLEWLEGTAREKSFSAVQQTVLERQAAVTADPIRRLELRYSLVKFYEDKKDLNAAQRNLEQLYHENPKIMGVVRSTVDFYWRNKERQPAIDVLLQAAKDAYPDLSKQFLFEAARKETDAGQYAAARKIVEGLAADSPYNDEYIAALADTYARSGDDQGLKAFYLAKIEQFRKAPMTQDARTREIAGLRRALVPALTRLKDFPGALDQYIEVVNKFPEDDALISETALYAQKYGRDQQLVNYYGNTIKQSPQDYRWPMVLAKTETQLEHYPAAIDAYGLAIQVRPDRVDMRQARAELLERTMRFDEAAADYQKLFDLNYHDTRWMEKLASVRAREGKVKETIAALEAALVNNRPEKPQNYFEVARRLESWGMLQQAQEFAQKGVDSAGRDLLAVNDNHAGAELYARIMTRLRQQDAAYRRLWTAVGDGNSLAASFDVALKQVEKNGIASVTDKQWREREIRLRQASAQNGMKRSMAAMGQTAGKYFTPEEKVTFSSWLDANSQAASTEDLTHYFLPVAGPAGLPEMEVKWDDRLMLSRFGLNKGSEWKSRLVSLQGKRMRFAELGSQLERYANTLSADEGKYAVLLEAADAYHQGAEDDRELAVLTIVDQRLSGEYQQRFFGLLMRKRPEELVNIAGNSNDSWAFPALQYVVRYGDARLTQQAVAARGHHTSPVWTPAYSALAGLYDADRSPAVKTSFITALGDGTIGERIAKPVNRERQLAGTTWFYYGSRYGEWMGTTGDGDPEEFLPAILEQSPGTWSSYITIAQYYADAKKFDRALQDYAHVLELSPFRADIHDKMALLLWSQQRKSEASAEWKLALEMFDAQVNAKTIPVTFWESFRYTLNHIGNRKLLAELRPQVDAVLRDYVRHNGAYESDGILREAYLAEGDPAAGTAWMLELSTLAPERGQFLQQLVNAKWIPANAKDPIYQQYLAQLQAQVQKTDALAKSYAQQDLRNWQVQYARFLVSLEQFDKAEQILNSLADSTNPGLAEGDAETPMPVEQSQTAAPLEVRMRIAIARNQFDSLMEQYKSHPEAAPPIDVLRSVARSLQRDGQRKPARKILEYVFAQEIAEHRLTAGNMLGLGEIRIQDGDLQGSLEILRRLTLVVGAPFENLEPAASLLSRTGHHAEAVEFLSQLMKATPWDERIRLKLAQEQLASGVSTDLAQREAVKVASDLQSAYVDREDAASMLKGRGAASLGSTELDALATGNLSLESVDKPHFYAARLRAAEKTTSPESKERLLLNALNDTPDRDAARIPLFTVLASGNKNRLAISAMEPMLNGNFLARPQSNRYEDNAVEDDDMQAGTADDDSSPQQVQMESELESVTTAQKAKLAFAVGKSYLKLQDHQKALQYFRTAKGIEPSKPAKTEIDKSIAALRATMKRIADNNLRMPIVHIELEQDRVVRPRLVEIAKAPPKSPPASSKASKGGAQ